MTSAKARKFLKVDFWLMLVNVFFFFHRFRCTSTARFSFDIWQILNIQFAMRDSLPSSWRAFGRQISQFLFHSLKDVIHWIGYKKYTIIRSANFLILCNKDWQEVWLILDFNENSIKKLFINASDVRRCGWKTC